MEIFLTYYFNYLLIVQKIINFFFKILTLSFLFLNTEVLLQKTYYMIYFNF